MEQMHNTQKAGDVVVGFFGWFLIGNLVLLLWVAILGYLRSNWTRESLYFGVPLMTMIVIGILFFLKRNWYAYGILAAVITNTLILILLGVDVLPPTAQGYLHILLDGATFPFPLGVAFFMQ
jgi:hypothetical protein